MSNNTVTLHRVLVTSPEKVFRAFTDSDAFASWLPPYGFVCKVHHMEFREKGTYKMSFTNFSTGNGHSFGGEFLEIKPNELIKYTDRFDDPKFTGRNDYYSAVDTSFMRHRIAHCTGRDPRCHSCRNVLPWVAGIIGKTKETGGARDSGCVK